VQEKQIDVEIPNVAMRKEQEFEVLFMLSQIYYIKAFEGS